jgi:hypothetical protein
MARSVAPVGQQRPRQRPGPRPDLEERLARLHGDRGYELRGPGGLEEVLAETLARAMAPRLDVLVRRRRHGVAIGTHATAPIPVVGRGISRPPRRRQYCSSMASISSSLRPK